MTELEKPTDTGLKRRTVLKSAAWSVPVIAAAVASPMAAASGTVVNGFQLTASCGGLGVLFTGFTLTAGTDPVPAGSMVQVVSTGTITASVIQLGAGSSLASVQVVDTHTANIVLSQDLPANGTLEIKWLLSIAVSTTTDANVILKAGLTPGTGVKSTAWLSQTLVACSAT